MDFTLDEEKVIRTLVKTEYDDTNDLIKILDGKDLDEMTDYLKTLRQIMAKL